MILRIMNTTRKGLNMFKSLNADLVKIIITEIKEMRKGVIMIVFIGCMLCALLDIVMRKHGTKLDWFTQIYLITGFFSFLTICIKIYNSYCDKQDAIKAEKQRAEQEYEKILDDLRLLKPIFDDMLFDEKAILYQFVKENSCLITMTNCPITGIQPIYMVNHINGLIIFRGYQIISKYIGNHVAFETTPQFVELLKLYFSEGLNK